MTRPLNMSSNDVDSVQSFTLELGKLLDSARLIKQSDSIEPALTISDFEGQIERIGNIDDASFKQPAGFKENSRQAHYAAIETAFRNIFYDLLVSPRLTGSLSDLTRE